MTLARYEEGTGARFEVPVEVKRALGALALATNHSLIPEQERVYAYALRDVDVPVLRQACLELAEQAKFFPKPVEIRERADLIARRFAIAHARKALPPATDERTFRCYKCQDDADGWLPIMHCPDVKCERTKPHGRHTFTSRCPCWLERNREHIRQLLAKALKDNRPIPLAAVQLDEMDTGRYRWGRPNI